MAQIIDSNYLSIGFPLRDWENLIERDNFIDSITSKLDGENKIVYLSGEEEGIGKTTLLGQFCKRNSSNIISLFFNPHHSLDLDLNYLRSNLYDQIEHHIGGEISENNRDNFITIENYKLAWFNLKKKHRNSQNKIYLTIDGLESRGSNFNQIVSKLLREIPYGDEYLRVIITGSSKKFQELCPEFKNINSEEISVIGLTNHQMEEFLGKDVLEKIYDRRDLIKATKGYPGRLEVLKRIINDGVDIEQISNSKNFKNWIDLDTGKIDLDDPLNSLIFSLLALSETRLSSVDISKISEKSIVEIDEKLKTIHVIEEVEKKIQFISLAHANYFNTLLRGKKRQVDDLLIRHYASSNTLIDKFELSKLYANQKKWNKIPELINERFLEETIKDTGSIDRVIESIDLGLKSSQEMKHYSEVFKFCVQGSIVNELDNYLFWESEIKARISLSDFVGAINLAERAVLKVDRLRLLSLVARKQKEINKNIDEELVVLIKTLYDKTNLAGVGNAIFDIVSNLIYAIPNLAIEIIERTTGNASESNINDWIVAKLSFAAISSEENENNEKEIKLKALEKLNNPSVKKIHRAISLMVGNYSSKRVLEEVGKLSDSNEKLKLLRLWLKNNRSHNANLKNVIQITLNELVSSSNDSESILETLNDLSSQLNKIRILQDKIDLLKRFKEFEGNIKQVGLCRDLYTYRLNIFELEHSIKKDKAEHILSSIIRDISRIEDNLIKIEAYCEVFYKLTIIKDFDLTIYYNRVYGRIKNNIEKLLNESANHTKITENILTIIGKVNPKFAIEICQTINTSFSRDSGRLKVIYAYLNNSIKKIIDNDINIIVSSFENITPKEIAIEAILERFSDSKSLPTKVVRSVLPYISMIPSINQNSLKLNCAILSLQIISKNTYWSQRMLGNQKKNLLKIWLEIESDWDRIDAGYNISSETCIIDSDFAKDIFEKTTEIKNQSWIDSKSVASTYIHCLRLIIKAYLAILKNKSENSTDFDRVKNLIDRIPSEIEKLQLWSEIAIGAIINENHDVSQKVYNNHIIPLTSSTIQNKKGVHEALECFVVIHYFNSDLAFEYLDLISEYSKEEACVRITDFYITQRNPFEHYEGEILNYKSTFDNLFKAIKVLNEIETDHLLYFQISEITKVIKEGSKLSKQQKTELRSRIEDIINVKLPDQKNITHQGYKILSKVQLELISKSATPWESYVYEAQQIPNVSDRLFVKGVLLEYIPSAKKIALKKQLIAEVLSDLDELSSHYDYVERVIHLSKIMYDLSRTKWQNVINNAFDISCKFDEGQEMYDYQRNILDTIYRIDEKFAKTLANKANKSNKETNKKLLEDYYETLELSKKIKNNQNLEDHQKSSNRMIIRAVVKAQGSLNSGKLMTKKIADVAKYLEIGKGIALSESYPIFSYFLSNSANIRLTSNVKSTVIDSQRETFEYMLNSVKLVELLSQKRKIEHSINTKVFIDEDFKENLVVKPNTREEAINYVRNWIINETEEFLIITDPYFEKEDIEILKFVKEIDKDVETFFLGCNDGSVSSLEMDFEKHWKKISDQEPPQTKVIFSWIPEDVSKKLIHDRWILSKNGGLRLGTSYRSLGANKESEISVIKPNEALNILENTIKGYLENKTRYLNNQKIKYKSFTL